MFICGHGLVVEHVLAKDETGVRFSLAAHYQKYPEALMLRGIFVPDRYKGKIFNSKRHVIHQSDKTGDNSVHMCITDRFPVSLKYKTYIL